MSCSPTGNSRIDLTATTSASTPLPCNVAQDLRTNCQTCHGAEPQFGAPMPLITWQDVQKASITKPTEKVYQLMAERLTSTQSPMPPPPNKITDGDRNLLVNWINAGAPAGTDPSCGAPGAGGTSGQGGTTSAGGSGVGGSGVGGSGVGGGSGGTVGSGGSSGGSGGYGGSGETTGYGDSGTVGSGGCTSFKFLAHGQPVPGDTTPYAVTSNSQYYEAFYFKSPWPVATQALSFHPIIDNTRVIHHWLLYATTTAYADGSMGASPGVHSDGTLLAGWAPGSGDWIMPPGVGMELPSGSGANLVLEVHYTSTAYAGQLDASGVDICATDQLQPNDATVSWLGTEGIFLAPQSPGTAQGTCTPSYQGQIHIIRSWPHEHKLGVHMTTNILRANGATDVLIDTPFDFNYQIGYETPNVINPGDKLVTTCSYNNTTTGTVTFGPATENEMCYNFVIAYPANTLQSAGLMQRSCML